MAALRAIATAAGLPHVRDAARLPGVVGVVRVSVHYADRRARDSVATLTKSSDGTSRLHVARPGSALNPVTYTVAPEAAAEVMAALAAVRFDALRDQPNLPMFLSVDFWLIERAAGAFTHSVIMAPTLATSAHPALRPYVLLSNAVRNGLAQAVRPL
jgi:hypothetical protein